MKKLLIDNVLVAVMFVIVTAGCGAKADDLQPNNSSPLVGRWEIGVARVYVKDAQGERIVGSFREGLAYKFYNDGTYDGCILPGSDWDNAGQLGTAGVWNCTTDKPGRWSLNITKADGATIQDGTITLTAPTLKKPFVLEKLLTYSPDKFTDAALSDTDLLLQGQTPVEKDGFGGERWSVYIFRKK